MIRGHKQGFPGSATVRNRRGKRCVLNTEENWCLCSWISTVPGQTGQPYSSLCARASSGVPHCPDPWQNENLTLQPLRCPSQHTCCCGRGGTHRHSTTPMQKNLWNSRFKYPCSFHHFETRVFAISFFLLPPRLLLCG